MGSPYARIERVAGWDTEGSQTLTVLANPIVLTLAIITLDCVVCKGAATDWSANGDGRGSFSHRCLHSLGMQPSAGLVSSRTGAVRHDGPSTVSFVLVPDRHIAQMNMDRVRS